MAFQESDSYIVVRDTKKLRICWLLIVRAKTNKWQIQVKSGIYKWILHASEMNITHTNQLHIATNGMQKTQHMFPNFHLTPPLVTFTTGKGNQWSHSIIFKYCPSLSEVWTTNTRNNYFYYPFSQFTMTDMTNYIWPTLTSLLLTPITTCHFIVMNKSCQNRYNHSCCKSTFLTWCHCSIAIISRAATYTTPYPLLSHKMSREF